MSDTQSEPNYQDILDKYAASLKSTENSPQEIPNPEPQNLLPEEAPLALESTPTPEAIIPPTPEPELTPESTLPEIPKENNFFKYLFFFSLFIFIIVLISVITSFINSQKSLSNSQTTPTITSSPTETPVTSCQINDQTYQIGSTFAATDGCNTCTCNNDLTISCTGNICEVTPTTKVTPTKSATVSAIPATWKTYTSTDFNFSFRYPSNYTIKDNSGQSISVNIYPQGYDSLTEIQKEISPSLSIQETFTDLTPQEWVKSLEAPGYSNLGDISNLTVGNKDATQYTFKNTQAGQGQVQEETAISFQKSTLLLINLNNFNQTSKGIYSQILSTFKFL